MFAGSTNLFSCRLSGPPRLEIDRSVPQVRDAFPPCQAWSVEDGSGCSCRSCGGDECKVSGYLEVMGRLMRASVDVNLTPVR